MIEITVKLTFEVVICVVDSDCELLSLFDFFDDRGIAYEGVEVRDVEGELERSLADGDQSDNSGICEVFKIFLALSAIDVVKLIEIEAV